MSNEEKRRREEYELNRNKWITIQAIIIAIVTIFTAIMGYIYFERSQTFYINYQESSQIDYRVRYDKNSFYEDEWQEKGQDYVGGLIEDIEIKFDYVLNTEARDVKYEYSYDVTAKMEVKEKGSSKELLPEVRSLLDNGAVKNQIQDSNSPLKINQTIVISYDNFNEYVRGYVNNFKLDQLVTNLIIKMSIDIKSTCESSENAGHNTYEMTVVIPLIDQVVSISESTSVPSGDGKLLACESNLEKTAFQVATIVGGSLDAIGIIVLICYIIFTRNSDIEYGDRVNKIVNDYKSYIQKINTNFNSDGYQILEIDTFEELLEIRDTIQEPILMSENQDKTCTTFIVPTNKQILYVYKVKVDNYDEIYGVEEVIVEDVREEVNNEKEEPIEEPQVEEPIDEQEEEKIEETSIEETEEEIVVETEEDNDEKNHFLERLNYSYEAKLVLSDFETIHYYREIITFVNTYGIKITRSWAKEKIHVGRKLFAVLTFRGKKLSISFPLDLKEYEGTKYRFIDMSEVKKYQNTPALMKLTSERKTKYAIELLEKLFKDAGLENQNKPYTYKKMRRRSKYQLIKAGLIKETKKEKETV